MYCVKDGKRKASLLCRYCLGDGVVIEETGEEGYKYLGILETDDNFQKKVKEKMQKEYYKRVRTVLKSKLNGGNVINAINISTVATVWCMGLE